MLNVEKMKKNFVENRSHDVQYGIEVQRYVNFEQFNHLQACKRSSWVRSFVRTKASLRMSTTRAQRIPLFLRGGYAPTLWFICKALVPLWVTRTHRLHDPNLRKISVKCLSLEHNDSLPAGFKPVTTATF